MKSVYNVRAMRTMAGPGVYGYDVEATVRLEDQTEVFVHVNEYDDFKHFTVGKESIYDAMTGGEEGGSVNADEILAWTEKLMAGEVEPDKAETGFIEEYTSYKAACASEYKEVFKVLKSVVDLLESGI